MIIIQKGATGIFYPFTLREPEFYRSPAVTTWTDKWYCIELIAEQSGLNQFITPEGVYEPFPDRVTYLIFGEGATASPVNGIASIKGTNEHYMYNIYVVEGIKPTLDVDIYPQGNYRLLESGRAWIEGIDPLSPNINSVYE
jgi:hypothetical protein